MIYLEHKSAEHITPLVTWIAILYPFHYILFKDIDNLPLFF